MSFLSMMEANLPPGFRFHPKDDELVCDYLAKKITHGHGHRHGHGHGHGHGDAHVISSFFGERSPMIDVDLNKCEPWDLPELACVGGKEWYLFSVRDRKYASGQRTNRATASGYWKATGKDRHITRKGSLVGMRKTLVFYQGRAPNGSTTDWVMHEFRMDQDHHHSKYINNSTKLQEDWVLCRIFYKARSVFSSKPPCSMDHHEDTCSNNSSRSLLLPVVPPMSMSMSMEKYITFGDQPAPLSFQQGYHEQVPCFSTSAAASPAGGSTTATLTMTAAAPSSSIQARVVPSTKISQLISTPPPPPPPPPPQFGAAGLPDHFGMNLQQSLTYLDWDNKKVIRAVLNHLTSCKNMEADEGRERPPVPPIPTTLGQGITRMDSYLCDINN